MRYYAYVKNIATESFSIHRESTDDIDALLSRAEKTLIAQNKHPLRVVLLEVSDRTATILASVLYEFKK